MSGWEIADVRLLVHRDRGFRLLPVELDVVGVALSSGELRQRLLLLEYVVLRPSHHPPDAAQRHHHVVRTFAIQEDLRDRDRDEAEAFLFG